MNTHALGDAPAIRHATHHRAMEYRHLRGWARVRMAAGTVLVGLGAVTLFGGSFNEGCRVGGAVPGGGDGATLVRRLGAGYRPLRISPNLSSRCSRWSGGC